MLTKQNTHTFTFNKTDNGGEQVILHTMIEKDKDDIYFSSQELTLHSYCNAAKFNLVGVFTPTKLRQLADELESAMNSMKYIEKSKDK